MTNTFGDARRAARVLVTTIRMLGPAVVALPVHRSHDRLYRRVPAWLTELGPAFVKAGQVLGTRRDVLPLALSAELSQLQDSVLPVSPASSRQRLTEIYGPDLSRYFPEIDYRPVASGSVACVYRARDDQGREVALKVRRHGIEALMEADLRLMRRGAALASRLPMLKGVPVRELIGQMCDAVLAQLDFAREADNMIRLRENLGSVPRVWVPQVYPANCRPECIVMEFIPDLDVRTPEKCPVSMRRRFAVSGLAAIYQMLFVDGFVHCDLHPGNLYFTRSGDVVVLDAGFSVQLQDRLRRLFAEFFLNMAVGRGLRCAEIVIESSAGVREDADLAGFTERMTRLVERSYRLRAREFSLIAFATEMFDLQRSFGIHAAPELIFPLLSLLVIEGTIRELDPEIDFQETAKPILNRGLFARSPAS